MNVSRAAKPHETAPRIEPLRALTGVAALAALGMLLGYARDASLAAVFGASAVTDAFFVATMIPTLVAAVLMSGALAPALLPVFRSRLEQRAQAWTLANTLLLWGGVILALCVALIFFVAPWFVAWLAPGLDSETNALAISLTQLSAPLLFLLGMSALLGACANALGSFRLPALATALVNGAAFFAILTFGPSIGIASAVVGLTIGALLQLLAQGVGLYRQGWRPAFAFAWHNADVRETVRLFLPLAAFVALAQIVPIVERVVGSMFPTGELSLVAYAGKLFQIPGVVLANSLAIVLYPHLVQTHAASQQDATPLVWHQTVGRGLRLSVFLTLPLALWFYWNAEPLVRLIFERGAFSVQDTQTAAQLLRVYVLAVVPAGMLLVLTRAFHAQRKMRLTLFVGVLSFCVYVAAAVFGARAFGLVSLPFAFFVSQVFGCFVLASLMFGRTLWQGFLHRDTLKLAAAGGVSALVLAFLSQLQTSWMTSDSSLLVALGLGSALLLMGLVYFGLAVWLGIAEARFYLAQAQGFLRISHRSESS